MEPSALSQASGSSVPTYLGEAQGCVWGGGGGGERVVQGGHKRGGGWRGDCAPLPKILPARMQILQAPLRQYPGWQAQDTHP